MPLTDTSIRNLKAAAKSFKMADGGGLYLLVKPTGSKAWRLDYRFAGRRKTLSFGMYPAFGLADARGGREAAKKLLARGQDPSAAKRLQRSAGVDAAANTFGVVAEEFLAKMQRDGRAEPTLVKNRWMIGELAAPLFSRPIGDISSAEVLSVLRRIEQSGRVESALATRAAIGRVFRYAIATARAENDPTFPLRGALRRHVPENHPAITDPAKVGDLMQAIYGYQGWPSLSAALKLQALGFARPGETRLMEWEEVDFPNAKWTIPASKTKMRRPHEVPLSQQSVEVLRGIEPANGAGRFVFPSMMSGKTVLSENSMNSALRRMGITHEQHTAHGFRAMASTILNGSGRFSADAIEAQLAHRDTNAVRRIYNRSTYWEERVAMMQWWADFLEEQRLGRGENG